MVPGPRRFSALFWVMAALLSVGILRVSGGWQQAEEIGEAVYAGQMPSGMWEVVSRALSRAVGAAAGPQGQAGDQASAGGEVSLPEAAGGPDVSESDLRLLQPEGLEDAGEDPGELAGEQGAGAPEEESEPEDPRPRVLEHVVQAGETLWEIARRYGTSVDSIVAANRLPDQGRLQVGQQLQVLTVPGMLHEVQRGETLWTISQLYRVDVNSIVEANGLERPDRLEVGQQLIVPGADLSVVREILVVNGRLQRAFSWPVQGRISSNFGPRWGRMHEGLDIAVPTGTPVRAAANGVVTFAGWRGGYGYLVVIDHGNGVETRYGHNSRLVAWRGQRVRRGQVVAYSGNTGNSTGPHVHFEIRLRGRAYDPRPYLR